MKNLFRVFVVFIAGIFALQLAGCSGEAKTEEKVVKIGINGEENMTWKYIRTELAKEGIKLEIMSFSDYIIPNTALADGEINANAFQTEIFFQKFVEQSGADLSVLCYTILAPMGIYPGTTKSIDEIPDGAKIAIPNDVSNGGRALILLQAAGLLKIDDSKGLLPTVKDILENPKNLEIIEMAPAQIPGALDELSVAAINNGVARESGLSPLGDSIFIEDTKWDYMTAYFNIIAVQTKDKDLPEMKRIVELYHSEEGRKLIDEEYKGSAVAAF